MQIRNLGQAGAGLLVLGLLVSAASAEAAGSRTIELFEPMGPLPRVRVEPALATASAQLTDAATFVRPNRAMLGALVDRAPDQLVLGLPFNGQRLELVLQRVDILAPGFSVVDETGQSLDVDLGIHYEGGIAGDDESRVALSLFRDEVAGMAYSPRAGNIQFGRVRDAVSGAHVVFAETSLVRKPARFECATDHRSQEAQVPADLAELSEAIERSVVRSTSTVGIYLEVANNLVVARGGSQGATTYVNTIFNLARQLYSNERIPVSISQLRLNTTADGYGGTQGAISSNLSRFQQARAATFPGQLAQLVGSGNAGGLAAGFAGFCASNRANSMCTSLLDGSYSNLPTWSYSVEVFTHELGHLMGSRHTHACVWNGNNTAIDGCAGRVEGSCGLPNVPASQGTIMSYCRGFSFNNGFGPQPGNVIRARYSAARCF